MVQLSRMCTARQGCDSRSRYTSNTRPAAIETGLPVHRDKSRTMRSRAAFWCLEDTESSCFFVLPSEDHSHSHGPFSNATANEDNR
ncbi:hypothetical protein INR49_020465 [Caranx melampygus]|nr:hypothetical protein INR49_020465 [Caranx melampygus]